MNQTLISLAPRDKGESHRAATPLELMFDLAFVVAIAVAAGKLHHGISEAHFVSALAAAAILPISADSLHCRHRRKGPAADFIFS